MYPEVIPVYAPATSRRKDAKVFELHGDEQITDADLTIDSKGTHILRGRVVAAGDHHAPSTIIRIKEESAGEGPRMVQMEDDGSFQVNYLPSGNYTLTIFSTDAPNPANPAAQPTEYKTVRLTAIVTDHDVLLDDVLVVPLKPDEKRDFFDLLN